VVLAAVFFISFSFLVARTAVAVHPGGSDPREGAIAARPGRALAGPEIETWTFGSAGELAALIGTRERVVSS